MKLARSFVRNHEVFLKPAPPFMITALREEAVSLDYLRETSKCFASSWTKATKFRDKSMQEGLRVA